MRDIRTIDRRSPRRSPRRKSPVRKHDRGRSSSPHSRSRSQEKKKSPSLENKPQPVFELCISNLSRNIARQHLQEIFNHFGKIVKIEHNVDRRTNLPMETCYVTYSEKADAEKAIEYMDQAQLDGQEIKAQFTLRLPRQIGGSPRRNPRSGSGRGKWRRSPSPLRGIPRRESPQNTKKRNQSPENNTSPSPKRVKATTEG